MRQAKPLLELQQALRDIPPLRGLERRFREIRVILCILVSRYIDAGNGT
jgi:hypothetical protein